MQKVAFNSYLKYVGSLGWGRGAGAGLVDFYPDRISVPRIDRYFASATFKMAASPAFWSFLLKLKQKCIPELCYYS